MQNHSTDTKIYEISWIAFKEDAIKQRLNNDTHSINDTYMKMHICLPLFHIMIFISHFYFSGAKLDIQNLDTVP